MNESLYAKGIWSRVGKIGKSGRGFLDTGWLDSAFGGADARRAITLNRIGDRRDEQDRRLSLAEKTSADQNDYRNRRMAIDRDAIDAGSRDALTGDIISGATLPVSYLEGRNRAIAVDKGRELQEARNKRWDSLIRSMG